jgi:hypothetical protein
MYTIHSYMLGMITDLVTVWAWAALWDKEQRHRSYKKGKPKEGIKRTTAYLVHATIISPENVTPATLAVRSPQLTTSVM